MRDVQAIEEELMEISALPDDTTKLERIAVWCAMHPEEIPSALHLLLGRSTAAPPKPSHPDSSPHPNAL